MFTIVDALHGIQDALSSDDFRMCHCLRISIVIAFGNMRKDPFSRHNHVFTVSYQRTLGT